jgi:hypothetical protein
VAAVAAAVAVILVLALPGPGAPPVKPGTQAKAPAGAAPVAKGSFPGLALISVRVPVHSLSPALAAQFRQGQTGHALMVTGFEFRNREAAGLCLTAVNTGATAGKNRDPVLVDACDRQPVLLVIASGAAAVGSGYYARSQLWANSRRPRGTDRGTTRRIIPAQRVLSMR